MIVQILRLCRGNTSPKNSVPRLHKAQHRTKTTAAKRSRDLHMCHHKPRTGHILDWKTNEPQNMSRNTHDNVVVFCCVFNFAYF